MPGGFVAFLCLFALLGIIYPFKPFGTRRTALAVAGIAFAATLAIACSGFPATSTAAAQTVSDCPTRSTAPGALFRVRGSNIEVRTGPSDSSAKIVNKKSSEILKITDYVTIGQGVTVIEDCKSGEWSRVRVDQPEWLRDSHRGWVPSRYLVPERDVREKGFTEDDIQFDKDTRPYKSLIVQAINRIAKEDSRCVGKLDASSVTTSPSKSKPGKPVFFVTCGSGTRDVVNVFFSEADVASNKTFAAPKHVDRSQAVRACETYAKTQARFPSTVEFSKFWDLSVTEHANGRTAVQSVFTAKNAFGLELTYNIRCLMDASGLFEANVFEKL